MKNTAYKPTQLISNIRELSSLRIGQWIQFDSGQRGQYLGETEHGTIIVRYQHNTFGKTKDTNGNHLLRTYAKENGSR